MRFIELMLSSVTVIAVIIQGFWDNSQNIILISGTLLALHYLIFAFLN